jgi:transposase-like protein
MQIISGIERRRRWQADEKLRIIAEAMQHGASVSDRSAA